MEGLKMEQEKHLIKIGDLAIQAGVTVRTVRYYEEMGLLSPVEVTSGGFRLYSENDVARLSFIKRFKDLGFSLEDIHRLLSATQIGESRDQRIDASYSLLQKQLEQIKRKISELEESKLSIQNALQSLEVCRTCGRESCPPNCSNQKVML